MHLRASDEGDCALASCTLAPRRAFELTHKLILLSALGLLLTGCNQETKNAPPQPRPVRTVTVEKGEVGEAVVLTGDTAPKTR